MLSKSLLRVLRFGFVLLGQPMLAPAQTPAPMASIPVSALIGLPITDAAHAVIGRVRTVARTLDGKVELIMPIGGLFGFGARLVPVPIDNVALTNAEIAVVDLPPHRFQQSPTWYGSNGVELSPADTIRIAKR